MKKDAFVSESILFSMALLVRTLIILRYSFESNTIDLKNTFNAFLERWDLTLTYNVSSIILLISLSILIYKVALLMLEMLKRAKTIK